MAVTRTLVHTTVFGNKQVRILRVVDTAYSAGGISMTAAQCGLNALDMLIPIPAGAVVTWSTVWDYTNNKIMVYTTADGVEVVAAVSLAAGPIYALCIGS